MKTPREIAYNLIEEWESKRTFLNLALKNALCLVQNERDRRFITALVYGVIEKKITLDHFINCCSERKTEKIELSVLSALRMGIYQMFYMQVPASAACNTSVELIKRRGLARSAGYVNAVLRRCDRERETLLLLKKTDFSVRYSIDVHLVDLLLEQYGKETFVSIMENIRMPDTAVYLYHNSKRGSETEFLTLLSAENIEVEHTDIPHLFKTAVGFSVENSAVYQNGWFHIVGYHSAQAAQYMPQNAKKVMDLCAAPGGKTFVMATQTNGTVFSFDLHEHKVRNLQNSAKRLGHNNIVAAVADSSVLMQEYINTADFVLCDVPCSGLGIMGKKPDMKYKRYNSLDFTDVQYRILEQGSKYLKPGCRLVYSTCTIDRRENEELVDRFLQQNPTFTLDKTALTNGRQTYLPERGADGFFIAVLKKGQ